MKKEVFIRKSNLLPIARIEGIESDRIEANLSNLLTFLKKKGIDYVKCDYSQKHIGRKEYLYEYSSLYRLLLMYQGDTLYHSTRKIKKNIADNIIKHLEDVYPELYKVKWEVLKVILNEEREDLDIIAEFIDHV